MSAILPGSLMSRASGTSEDHGGVVVYQHAVLAVPAYGALEHDAFDVRPCANQLRRSMTVGHSYDILLDDGALIEIRRRIVRRRPD